MLSLTLLWIQDASLQDSAALPPPRTQARAEYQIGPDDILRVTVYGHDDLSQTVVVQPDGTIIYPLIGRVEAANLTPTELARKIAELLARGFIRNPQATVLVQEYRSKTVFVVGEVTHPGAYPLAGGRTVVEILSKAGPLTAGASSEVVVVRPRTQTASPVLPSEVDRQRAEVIRVNVRDIQAGDIEKNIPLQPNDTVFVPVAPKVYVSGEVRSPGAFAFAPGLTVRQLISMAGGFSEDASSGRIRVVRQIDGKAKELKVKLDDAVQSGDTIVVKAKLF